MCRCVPPGWLSLLCVGLNVWLGRGRLACGSEGERPAAVFPGLAVYGGKAPRVEAVGRIAEGEGDVLEFLAVESAGRAYESLLTLECRPSGMQAALLLLGCKPHEKQGTRLSLELEWSVDGRAQRVPIENLLLERRTRKAPAPLPWIFTGSQFVRLPGAAAEVFLADAEEAFIGLYGHAGLLIQLGGDFGNPYRSPEAGFAANASKLPQRGAEVRLILRMRP